MRVAIHFDKSELDMIPVVVRLPELLSELTEFQNKLHWWWDEEHGFKTADEAIKAVWELWDSRLAGLVDSAK